jgi:hypothetical protein
LERAAAPVEVPRVAIAWVLLAMLVAFLVAGAAAWLIHG